MTESRLRYSVMPILTIGITLLSFSALNAGSLSYKVHSGDTLWALAARHHTTPKAIAQANGISENAVLALGKSIRIPTKDSIAKSKASQPSYAGRPMGTVSRSLHTKANSVALRSGPGKQHSKVAMLQEGTDVKLIGRSGVWAKVALNGGACGFIHSSLLSAGPGTSKQPTHVQNSSADAPKSQNVCVADASLIETALDCRGSRYSRGGVSRGGFDCSGFTRYVFAKYGMSLPHSSAAQSRLGKAVSRTELQPTDLVFFQTNRSGISHVGIYIGNNQFVHAARYGRGVTVDSLGSGYYNSRFRCARRVK